jgi:hypothetical protein
MSYDSSQIVTEGKGVYPWDHRMRQADAAVRACAGFSSQRFLPSFCRALEWRVSEISERRHQEHSSPFLVLQAAPPLTNTSGQND